MAVYVVGYDVRSDEKREAVAEYLEGFGARKRKLQLSLYLIASSDSARAIRDQLRNLVGPHDRLWVSRYRAGSGAAWRNTEDPNVAAWLRKYAE